MGPSRQTTYYASPWVASAVVMALVGLPGCALSGRTPRAEAVPDRATIGAAVASGEQNLDASLLDIDRATIGRAGASGENPAAGVAKSAAVGRLVAATSELPLVEATTGVSGELPETPEPPATASPTERLPPPERLPTPRGGMMRPVDEGRLLADLDPANHAEGRIFLPTILRSVAESYPLVEIALLDLLAADGKALAAWGDFDTKFSAHSVAAPQGFYENYRQGLKLARPRFSGGEIYGGYRLGDGNIQPWFGERQTNEGGEFKTGLQLPWMKDRHIDARRQQLWLATLARQQLEPEVQARMIEFMRLASQHYWAWLAANQVLDTQSRLYQLAEERNEPVRERVRVGDLPKLSAIDNERFIADRDAKRIEAERKFQESAIKLSLFYRGTDGMPLIAPREQSPDEFPPAAYVSADQLGEGISQALAARPEMAVLDFERRQVAVELQYARNLTLPKLDTFLEASQDVGQAASAKRDKSPFELEAGILAEVPLQRREGAGKIEIAEAKLRQIEAKRRFMRDKIVAEVQDAVSALNLAAQRVERTGDNVRLAQQARELGEQAFRAGDIDLIALNIYETAAADAELFRIQAYFDYFAALANFRAALGIDVYRLVASEP